MSRAMSAGMSNALDLLSTNPVHLVELHFDSGIRYHTDAKRDIAWGGNTYLHGDLILVGGLTETTTKISKASLVYSGASQFNLATALSEPYIDRTCLIYKGELDAADALVIDPFLLFKGQIDRPSYAENPLSGTAKLTWHLTTKLALFEAVSGRRATDEDQRIHYPQDRFFEVGPKNLSESPWGKP